jgi:uncharacterized repeat protein (TIGR01451 family)
VAGASDQYSISVSGAGSSSLTNTSGTSIAASAVQVLTTGTGTGNFSNATNPSFYATAGQVLTLTDAIASGSSALGEYDARLTCTNAYTGTGATPNASLPNDSAVSSYDLTPAAGDDITCTYTNTPRPRITVQKSIAAAGGGRVAATDQFLLNSGTSSGTTTGSGSSVTSTAVLGLGTAGSSFTISEAASGTTSLANYSTAISCSNSNGSSSTVLPSGSGTSFNLTPANNDVISCTLTNTRRSATLTLVKTWVDAATGDAVDFTADGINDRTFASVANSASETDTDATTVTVFAGETIALSESFTSGTAANYTHSLSCTGNNGALTYTAGAASGSLLISGSDSAITCTFTNTRRSATLALAKTWVDALVGETAALSTTGGTNNPSLNSTANSASETDTGSTATVFAGETLALAETVSNSANYNSALACSGNGTALSGSNLTVNPADTAIVCTFTNTRRSATLTLAKTWVNATVGDAISASSSGGVNSASLNSTADSASETDIGSSATVFAGETHSLSESFTNGTTSFYTSGLACSGNGTALSGSNLTVNPADTAITCTYTNTRKADMVIDVSGLPATATEGAAYSGTIVCTNSGGSAATAATCSVSGLPAGLSVSCLPVPPTDLAVGASITCTVSGTPTTPGVSTVSVTTSATNEGDTGNNSASPTITVGRSADLSISKSDSPDPVVAGNTLTYTITVTNNGPSAIASGDSFTVSDALPAGLSGCVYTPASGSYNSGTGAWSGVTLPNGDSVTLTIACTLSAGFSGGSLSNTATVNPPAGVTDPVAGNDSAGPVVTTVARESDLSVAKSDGTATVLAGGSTNYTIVVSNDGPSNADGAVLTDPAVAGLNVTAVSCTGTSGGAACPVTVTVPLLQGAGLVIPTLPSGGTVTFTVTATVTATGQ